jgi:Amt family ammonium transporter
VGLVGITANCDCVEPWAAFVIGIGSGIFFIIGSWLLEKFHVDDPCDAIPCHFFGGLWGILATGIFSNTSGLIYSEFDNRALFFAW